MNNLQTYVVILPAVKNKMILPHLAPDKFIGNELPKWICTASPEIHWVELSVILCFLTVGKRLVPGSK